MVSRVRLRARLAAQDGFTLVEMITVLAILSIVLSGIMVLFVAGIHAEVDMNERFQAEQQARLALSSLRRDIRTACSVDTATMTSAQVKLGYCHDPLSVTHVTDWTTWCVPPVGSPPYTLFRQTGSACDSTTGTKQADRLVSNAVFALVYDPSTDVRPRISISLDVDANPAKAGGAYLLEDKIMLRNWRAP